MKIGYQLKQVRERLAKGLVDKGILRTEKRNFLLFDMATHPVADGGAKDEIRRRVRNVLTNRTVVLPPSPFLPENLEFRYLRTISMVCAAYAANVLENALATLGHESRERAFAQVDELLAEYSQWPFGKRTGGSQGIGANLSQVITDEINENKDKELQLEVRQYRRGCHHSHGHISGPLLLHMQARLTLRIGCGRMSKRVHQAGLTPLSFPRMWSVGLGFGGGAREVRANSTTWWVASPCLLDGRAQIRWSYMRNETCDSDQPEVRTAEAEAGSAFRHRTSESGF